jgi:glyoxylase-like metal-dependent hydrolase (beta-lactamase superfamily II)
MFGNVPRELWAQWLVPDAQNRLELACRCLLVEDLDGRTVLFEAGIGAFFDPKRMARYGVHEDEHVLLRSLAARGVAHEDVDVVVLSHLHFDHAGGLLGHSTSRVHPSCCFRARASSSASAPGSVPARRIRAIAPRTFRSCRSS